MRIGLLYILWILPAALLCDVCLGHEDITPRIRNATGLIAEQPNDAARYVHRGNLYRKYSLWEAAFADFERAAELSPKNLNLSFLSADVLRRLDRIDEATEALAPFLKANPDHLQARIMHAHLLALGGQVEAADAAFLDMLNTLPHPTADYYVEWIDALVASGPEHVPLALKRIQDALNQLGPVPSIHLKAMRLEESRGDFDAALRWLEPMVTSAQEPTTLLLQKARLLKQADRNEDARATYREALAAWERRPAWARKTVEAQDILRSIQEELP